MARAATSSVLVPPEAFAAALTTLPEMGPARLRDLLDRADPETAWALVLDGRAGSSDLSGPWQAAAQTTDPLRVLGRCRALGVAVVVRGDAHYPDRLQPDPEAPAVLFVQGDLAALRRPAVAIVGTRNATPYGIEIARRLGHLLAGAGACVVSGLALGIDGAAHRGALDAQAAPVVGVVASGLDVVYPPRHRTLWRQVAERGALLSEAPPGTQPRPWRFPARNRIIASVADVVVVVESRQRGGSLSTAADAAARGRTVLAVPGSIASPASAGTNRLIADGAVPLCDLDDVLVALGLAGAPPAVVPASPSQPSHPVLDALAGGPLTIDALTVHLTSDLGSVIAALARCEEAGLVVERDGWWHRVG